MRLIKLFRRRAGGRLSARSAGSRRLSCHVCNSWKGQHDFDVGAVEDVKEFFRLYRAAP